MQEIITPENKKKDISNEKWEKILARWSSQIKGLPALYRIFTFDNFVVNDNNRKVFMKCNQYSKAPNGFLTITGNTGSGKTHLAVSSAKRILPIELTSVEKKLKERELKLSFEHFALSNSDADQNKYSEALKYYHSTIWHYRSTKVLFLGVIKFLIELFDLSYKNFGNEKSKNDFLRDILRYDCIILDDLGSEKLSESVRQNLYYIIDEFYINKKFLIVTSNNTIDEINQRDPRIASRLSSGTILHINDYDHRMH